MAKNPGFNAKFGSRAMRPGETDVPNPAPGRQSSGMSLGSLKGPKSTLGPTAPTKVGKGLPQAQMQFPAKRGRRGV